MEGDGYFFVYVSEQVMSLLLTSFSSERKGVLSYESGSLWLTICSLGWELPYSLCLPGGKEYEKKKKTLVLLVCCSVGHLPTKALLIDLSVLDNRVTIKLVVVFGRGTFQSGFQV